MIKRDLINKLRAEGITSLSDVDLNKALSGCVGYVKLLKLAKELRDKGELKSLSLPSASN